ncbi:MAG: DMT family transporter [Ignavibacteriales bacterium]|nr:DMT family transporter [Ignavibacteriales bacterium]
MLLYDYVLLILLSAIWGASFIFMRILAPALGPMATADLRVLIAGLSLAAFLKFQKQDLEWKKNWKRYLVIGLLNSGIPFLLFSFAALHLPASVSVIINSMTPLFGAIAAVIWLGEKMTGKILIGIFLGITGVVIIRGGGSFELSGMTTLAMGACMLATMFYAVGGVYVKLKAHDMTPPAIATGSQLIVGILFLPLLAISPMKEITTEIVLSLLAFAIFCSAIAYLIYYRLLKILGPTKATTVTFLIPVFGFIWGWLFLSEEITPGMIIGGAIVLSAIYFVTGKKKS